MIEVMEVVILSVEPTFASYSQMRISKDGSASRVRLSMQLIYIP